MIRKIWTRETFITILVALGILLLCCVGCTEKKVPETPVVVETPEGEFEVNKDVYVTDNINDENSGIVTEPNTTISFWYIFYEVKSGDNQYEGYKIVQLPYPYFDLNKVQLAILPTADEKDYVGIKFFKRVPLETYKSYLANK